MCDVQDEDWVEAEQLIGGVNYAGLSFMVEDHSNSCAHVVGMPPDDDDDDDNYTDKVIHVGRSHPGLTNNKDVLVVT